METVVSGDACQETNIRALSAKTVHTQLLALEEIMPTVEEVSGGLPYSCRQAVSYRRRMQTGR